MDVTSESLSIIINEASCDTIQLSFGSIILARRIPDSKVHGTNMGPSGADRTQVGPMLAPWTLLPGMTGFPMTSCYNTGGGMSSVVNWHTGFRTWITVPPSCANNHRPIGHPMGVFHGSPCSISARPPAAILSSVFWGAVYSSEEQCSSIDDILGLLTCLGIWHNLGYVNAGGMGV